MAKIETVEQLEESLSRPTPAVVQTLSKLQGDLVILGVGGKMGPTLARMAKRALDEAGSKRSVIGVARFSTPGAREGLEKVGIRTVPCDLLNADEVCKLPDAGAVIFMAAVKFGSTGAESTTWATNAYLPGLVAERYRQAPHVVFSTGNVYPMVPIDSGGVTEEVPVAPIGDYAQSALGRERVFEFFSRRNGTPMTMYRLNYAVECRYGVLLDIAQKVWSGETIDLRMGYANVIWQGDANAAALLCLSVAKTPPEVMNVTGPETVSVRKVAAQFGELLGKKPVLQGTEEKTAFLNNASKSFRLFGKPTVSLETIIPWVAHWVKAGGATLNKPTHFETRDGKF